MYLYSLIEKEYDRHEETTVRDIYLLQHENNYTQEEFDTICDQYKKYSNWDIAHLLEKHHGFRIVPTFKL